MNLFADSSALMCRYLKRKGGKEVDHVFATATRRGVAAITKIEVVAALCRLENGGAILSAARSQAIDDLEDDADYLDEVVVSDDALANAYRVAQQYGLKGYDCVQLGSALIWKQVLSEQVTFATFDDQLWDAALAEGLDVWPSDTAAFK